VISIVIDLLLYDQRRETEGLRTASIARAATAR